MGRWLFPSLADKARSSTGKNSRWIGLCISGYTIQSESSFWALHGEFGNIGKPQAVLQCAKIQSAIVLWAKYHEFVFNPARLINTKDGRIMSKDRDNKSVELFYISTTDTIEENVVDESSTMPTEPTINLPFWWTRCRWHDRFFVTNWHNYEDLHQWKNQRRWPAGGTG